MNGIMHLDAETGRIRDVNPFLTDLLGFSQKEVASKIVSELGPFKDIESNEVMLLRLQKDGHVRYEHLPLETRVGRKIGVEFVSNVYQAEDCDMIQCNVRDTTEHKRVEAQVLALNAELEERVIKRTAELQIANQEMEPSSHSVAHDLCAPLRHIGGFCKILATDFGPTMATESKELLRCIEDAVIRMGLLVDSLLSLAKLGRQSLRLSQSELNPIVDEVISMLQPDCNGRDVEWRIAKPPALDCHPILMHQVFQKLLGNAEVLPWAKAVIEVDSIQEPGEPVIIFCAITARASNIEYADRLFGVFQRFHIDAEFEGSGVCLATVHRIIQKHGGSSGPRGSLITELLFISPWKGPSKSGRRSSFMTWPLSAKPTCPKRSLATKPGVAYQRSRLATSYSFLAKCANGVQAGSESKRDSST
jgi:PAS domain S-box-containing protein